jgi:mannosylglycerate hydrolase
MKKRQGCIVSHTHWDREWRAPIWESRLRLIKLMDTLLERFDNDPSYHSFLLDGQVIAIDDYLAEKPECEDKIRKLVADKKLFIGPWYNLPDEYPLCGEALVRNLLKGFRRSQELGHVLKIGYTTFGWGQTAQLPQIYAGFGMDFIVAGKHVSRTRAPSSEFMWESPDGTSVLTTRLGEGGRANFFFNVFMPAAYGHDYYADDWMFSWPGTGFVYHEANVESAFNEHRYINNFKFHKKNIEQYIEQVWHSTDDSLVEEFRFMGDGCDYAGPNPILGDIIKAVRDSEVAIELTHCSIEDYAQRLKDSLKVSQLSTVFGELRDGPVAKCSGNALAIRMPIKTLNRIAQRELIRLAEPFAVLSTQLNIKYHAKFIDRAWDYLMQSHSHDAINGVTLDKTSIDICYRLRQVSELARAAFENTASEIMSRIDVPDVDRDAILLTVFNHSSRPQAFIAEAAVDIPLSHHAKTLKIFQTDGRELSYQPVSKESLTAPICVQSNRSLPFRCDRHSFYFNTGLIEPYGYKVLNIKTDKKYDPASEFWPEDIDYGSQVTGINSMSNNFIEVLINGDGTFDITDKKTGRIYKGLQVFEDSGDMGDYWQRKTPGRNETFYSKGLPSKVSLIEDGPLVTRYMIKYMLELPAQMDFHKQLRSKQLTNLCIESTLTLRSDSPFLEVTAIVNNTACDHRLRVCFPTNIDSDYSYAQGHFYVDKRPVEVDRDENGCSQSHMKTLPMQNFVSVCSGDEGFAVLNKNIMEYEIADDHTGNISLTLLRCVPVRICSEFRAAFQDPQQQGSQGPGRHIFEYAIMPHTGDWQDADIFSAVEKYLYPPSLFQMSKPSEGTLPANACLLNIQPEQILLEAVKSGDKDNSIIVRLSNPSDKNVECEIAFFQKVKTAFLTNLNEEPLDQIKINDDGIVRLQAGSNKIITLLCLF